jgi:hypothetical protein
MKKLAFAAAIALSALPSQAFSENCRALAGPERKACAMREHPEQFQARVERCKELARERGATPRGGGMKDFVRNCLRGQQH